MTAGTPGRQLVSGVLDVCQGAAGHQSVVSGAPAKKAAIPARTGSVGETSSPPGGNPHQAALAARRASIRQRRPA
jgi:hypothetical protein